MVGGGYANNKSLVWDIPVLIGSRPVSMADLLGVQTLAAVRWWVSLIPSLARASILGVRIVLFPNAPTSPYPKSSARKITMFGLKLSDPTGERRAATTHWTNTLSLCMSIMPRRSVVIRDIYTAHNNGLGTKSVFWCVHVFLCAIWHKWIWRLCPSLVCNNLHWITRESKHALNY